MHAGKLGQVINFTIVGGTAKHCVDQYMVLLRYCSLGDNTSMPDGLHTRFCLAFLFITVTVRVSSSIRRFTSVPTFILLYTTRPQVQTLFASTYFHRSHHHHHYHRRNIILYAAQRRQTTPRRMAWPRFLRFFTPDPASHITA